MSGGERITMDHLNLANDKHLLSLFKSLSLDCYLKADTAEVMLLENNEEDLKMKFNEEVVYSSDCEVLSFNYSTGEMVAKASVVLVLSNRAMYLFPPLLVTPVDELNSERSFLVYNSFDRFLIEEIALLSLPYASAVAQDGHSDYALRTEDFALHFHDSKTLWIRAPSGRRSELGQAVAEAYSGVVGADLDLNHCDYKELIQWISDSTVGNFVTQVKCAHFTKQSSLFEGWLTMASFKPENYSVLPVNSIISSLQIWQTRWFYLSRHDLWHFANGEEVESYKFALAAPKKKRANLPKYGRISLPRDVDPQEVTLADGTVCMELDCDDRKFLFYPSLRLGAQETVKAWINAIRERKFALMPSY
eukprot:TRINITY_DN8913_c0_g2_i1.p1 TRINITY_DN8913_c0_g2~~TRINITY_DN8913_c0_g2_i1.p1  ORF type:complete len:362 (-),score=78.47 TRINITY_DN8913_c0_g2_i1:963-2048(-)